MDAEPRGKRARKRGRLPGQSKHPGVVPVETPRGWQARWRDPRTGKWKSRSLTVEGDVTFGADIVVEGDAVVRGSSVEATVPDGTVLRGVVEF